MNNHDLQQIEELISRVIAPNTKITSEIADELSELRKWVNSDDPVAPGIKIRLDRLENTFGNIKWLMRLVAAGILTSLGGAIYSAVSWAHH